MPHGYEYLLYVDEAGDPGLTRVRPIDHDGSSEWLVLAGLLTRASNEQNAIQWVKNIRNEIGATQGPSLHFRRLNERRKLLACKAVASLPVRAFVILSNKKNMRRYDNPRASKIPSQQWFYNWCIRLLLERTSHWCDWHAKGEFGSPRQMKILFSQRGGHLYSQTKAYYHYIQQKGRSGPLFLDKRHIAWDVVNWDLMEEAQHRDVAGLQLADVVASAFFQAADTLNSKWSPVHAKELYAIVARENGEARDFGVTLMPTPPWKARLNPRQQQIFRHYGYVF